MRLEKSKGAGLLWRKATPIDKAVVAGLMTIGPGVALATPIHPPPLAKRMRVRTRTAELPGWLLFRPLKASR